MTKTSFVIVLFVLIVLLALATSAIDTSKLTKKVEPELISQLQSLSNDDLVSIILIANSKLNQSAVAKLEELDAKIVRNFTLASWYEIEAPAGKIAELQKLGFVMELKAVKTEKALKNSEKVNEEKTKSGANYILLLFILLTAAILFYIYKKKSSKKSLLLLLFFIILPLVNAQQNDKAYASETFGFDSGLITSQKQNSNQKLSKSLSVSNENLININSANYEEKMDPEVYSAPGDEVKIIVEVEKPDNSLMPLSEDGDVKKFSKGKFQSLTISKDNLDELEDMPNVKKVWVEKEYEPLLDLSVPIIEANTFWNNSYNGSGIKVCVLDTGINKAHAALNFSVIAEKDFVTADSDGDNPIDYHGHGTHVAGTVASTDATYRGVAFGASILNAKVFSSSSGTASTTDIMAGIDWCINQSAHILTLSLGGKDEQNDGSDALSQYVDLAVEQGKIVTIAAGNSGPSGGDSACRTSRDSSGASYSICEPGIAHKVITVGSSQTGKSGTTKDSLSGFSSRGPTGDERIKPDVIAPGQVITSAWKDGSFNSISGTSMATPHVAGLAALLLQARNSLAPEEMKALLMNSVYDYGVFAKDNDFGAGRINATRAFNEINFTKTGNITKYDKVHNIFVPSGTKEIRVTLYWPENYSVHYDVDLYVLEPSGKIRDYSLSQYNTDERVKISNPTVFGYWKILVNPFDVNGTQKYAIASSMMPSEQFFFKNNSAGNITFHQINVTQSKQLKVNIDWNQTSQDINILLYNTSGNLKAYSNATNTSHENITLESAEAGLWLLKVVPAGLGSFSNIKYNYDYGNGK